MVKRISHKQLWVFISLLGLVIAWTVLFFSVTPKEIVATLGVSNTYIVAGVFALVGGMSIVSAASFYTTLITFIIGGSNPFILAIVTGPLLTVADYVFFRLGDAGRSLLSGKPKVLADRFGAFMHRQPLALVQGVIFIYTAATPFPDDILMFAIALGELRWRQFIVPLLLGNTTLIVVLTFALMVLGVV